MKEELKDRYTFKTSSDTEVLLASYMTWGESCLDRFVGMYGFAIYDTAKRTLFAARDRLGIKPFYYTHSDGVFSFASEIKGLLALGMPAEPDMTTIFDYLKFGFYDHSERTFFDGIHMLRPGCALRFAHGTVTKWRYWDIAKTELKAPCPLSDKAGIQAHFRELVADSIRIHFRSDVPVGVNVSSGIDSTSLLFFSEQVTRSPFEIFTVCISGSPYDECPYTEKVLTDAQRTRWHRSYLEPKDLISWIEKMTTVQDEPYGGIPTLSYAPLHKQAKELGITVLLEGQGIDEILAGYESYQADYLRDLFREKKFGELASYIRFKHGSGKSVSSIFPFFFLVFEKTQKHQKK